MKGNIVCIEISLKTRALNRVPSAVTMHAEGAEDDRVGTFDFLQ